MQNAGFEWDEVKAAENFAKHGVTFDAASRVFRDPFAIERIDDRVDYEEERFVIVGVVEERLLFVAFTMRAERIRIISARRAGALERREYHEENP